MKQTVSIYNRYEAIMSMPGVTPVLKPLYIGGYGNDYLKFTSGPSKVQKPTLASCNSLTDVLAIQADGAVIPCCLYPAPPEDFNLGNIFANSLEEIIYNKDRLRMDRLIKSGQAPTEVCSRSCDSSRSLTKKRIIELIEITEHQVKD